MVTTLNMVVKPWYEQLYNWRWLLAYQQHLLLGTSYEAAYDQADYECNQPAVNSLWSGDYSDVEPEERRKEYVGS